jgi:hypothetical protein
VFLQVLSVIGKKVFCLLPRLVKRETGQKEARRKVHALFLNIERFRLSYV